MVKRSNIAEISAYGYGKCVSQCFDGGVVVGLFRAIYG